MNPLSYADRAKYALHPIAKKLFFLMENKKTNLALSVDVVETEHLIGFAETIGDEICILKTHVDILSDFNFSFIKKLKNLSKKHEFLIFEDRKFADIGHTVSLQYHGGLYQIAKWADLVNAHSFSGRGIIRALNQANLILLANMSSEGCLADTNYIARTLNLANEFPQTVLGFIATHKISNFPGHVHLTPGIQFIEKNDLLGQHYVTPERAILENKTDILIVGRGILKAENSINAARAYKKAGWQAYLNRLCERHCS